MFYKYLIVTSLILSSSFSIELDDIVNKTFNDSYDLKKIHKNIQIENKNIELSQKWQNPMLKIGATDIHFSDTFQRDKEPMQSEYISISQIIPINNKLKYQKDMAIEDKKIVEMDLENKKLKIKSLIFQYGYNILIVKEKINLIDKYQNNTKELEKISLSLYQIGKLRQTKYLNIKLLNSKLNIQKENLTYLLKNLNYKLENLTYNKIDKIDNTIELSEIHNLNEDFDSHPIIQAVNFKKSKFNTLVKLEQAKKFSDIKVNAGYYSRDYKYQDYANLSISIPLPIYGRENTNIAKAKYKVSQTNDDLEIIKNNFKNNFSILKEDMKKSFRNYKTLSINMIPQREFIQENIETHYTLGHNESIDIFNNINETINLELMALDELGKYYTAYSKSKYYTRD